MTDAARNPDDYCYRHPDRLSFVLCERCGRTICLECQNHVNGQVLCPDDATARVTPISAARTSTRGSTRLKRARPQATRLLSRVTPETPIVTYTIMAVLALVFLVDAFTGYLVTAYFAVEPGRVLQHPWSLLTSMILSGGILGLLFNGYSLFILGRQFERVVGRQKFIVLYVISGFSASVFAFLLDGSVISATGAIFGLVGATVVMARKMGGNHRRLYIICAVILVLSILFGSWQAAIGGGLAGAAIAFTYLFDNGTQRERKTRFLLGALVAVLLVLAVIRALIFQAA
jgi:membrane associated rhomboid family serine protease